jgi:hypothetical protein
MLDIEKFKQSFNKLLNSQEDFIPDPSFKIFNQFFYHDCAAEVDFSCFTLDEAEAAYEALCCCATEEELEYEEDFTINEGNPFYEFCKTDDLFWNELFSLPAKKVVNDDYF